MDLTYTYVRNIYRLVFALRRLKVFPNTDLRIRAIIAFEKLQVGPAIYTRIFYSFYNVIE